MTQICHLETQSAATPLTVSLSCSSGVLSFHLRIHCNNAGSALTRSQMSQVWLFSFRYYTVKPFSLHSIPRFHVFITHPEQDMLPERIEACIKPTEEEAIGSQNIKLDGASTFIPLLFFQSSLYVPGTPAHRLTRFPISWTLYNSWNSTSQTLSSDNVSHYHICQKPNPQIPSPFHTIKHMFEKAQLLYESLKTGICPQTESRDCFKHLVSIWITSVGQPKSINQVKKKL